MSLNIEKPQFTGEAHLPYTLALITALGGVVGYMKSRSVMSLLGGCGVGVAYAIAGLSIDKNEAERGHAVAFCASAALAAMMGRRYKKTRALVPAGLLAGVGVAAAAYHGAKYRQWTQ